jgi:DNA invertase Pin-like site-specific DNA recombinase
MDRPESCYNCAVYRCESHAEVPPGCHTFDRISDGRRRRCSSAMRVSKADGSQTTDPQRDALVAAGVDDERLYEDKAFGRLDDRPGLAECLKSLRDGDTLMVWKLDRLGRNLHHLVNTVHDLTARNIGLKVLTGQGAAIDTTTAAGKLVFGIFAALAEFERELISERTVAGLASARDVLDGQARHGGRRALQGTRDLPADPLPARLTGRRSAARRHAGARSKVGGPKRPADAESRTRRPSHTWR